MKTIPSRKSNRGVKREIIRAIELKQYFFNFNSYFVSET